MVILISQSSYEQSTDEVIDWLFYEDEDCDRINGSDFLGPEHDFSITISCGSSKNSKVVHENKNIENLFNNRKRSFLWFRRWHDECDSGSVAKSNLLTLGIKGKDKLGIYNLLRAHIKNEKVILSDWILSCLKKNNRSLNKCGFVGVNKLGVLEQAVKCGLNIPETLVTNSKHELLAFLKNHKRIITKALSDSMMYVNESGNSDGAVMYTEEITDEFINKLPLRFGASLFQALLDKAFELRIFFLDNKFYTMAIFSQSNPKTIIDFRRYDRSNANRCIPFTLPKKLEKKLSSLLKQMNLQSASIDMVYTCDDKYIFLEINPNGQFGMVSKPCNYYLEEKVADFLIRNSEEYL